MRPPGDERGQDVIEYALLAALVALAVLVAIGTVRAAVATAYQAWNSAVDALWMPPDPGSPP